VSILLVGEGEAGPLPPLIRRLCLNGSRRFAHYSAMWASAFATRPLTHQTLNKERLRILQLLPNMRVEQRSGVSARSWPNQKGPARGLFSWKATGFDTQAWPVARETA
jgi:hypothetical protein